MKSFAAAAALGPFAQFLRPAAVEGHPAVAERQSQAVCGPAQMGQHGRHVDGPPGKQLFEGPALFRGFGMEGKSRPAHADLEFLLQLFNTPGNEIAPGSDIVGEYFQDIVIRHGQTAF